MKENFINHQNEIFFPPTYPLQNLRSGDMANQQKSSTKYKISNAKVDNMQISEAFYNSKTKKKLLNGIFNTFWKFF